MDNQKQMLDKYTVCDLISKLQTINAYGKHKILINYRFKFAAEIYLFQNKFYQNT